MKKFFSRISSSVADPGCLSLIPDPGVKTAPDPGSATLISRVADPDLVKIEDGGFKLKLKLKIRNPEPILHLIENTKNFKQTKFHPERL